MTELSTKCAILEEFIRFNTVNNTGKIMNPKVRAFAEYNNLGIPLAISVVYRLATLTDEGARVIEETWLGFCWLMEIDPTRVYDGLEDILLLKGWI